MNVKGKGKRNRVQQKSAEIRKKKKRCETRQKEMRLKEQFFYATGKKQYRQRERMTLSE